MVIELTDKAREKFNEMFPTMEENKAFKIYIAAYGWGGPVFGMVLDEPKDTDLKVTVEGYDFIMDKDFDDMFGKFVIDYSEGFLRKGFTVRPSRGGSGC